MHGVVSWIRPGWAGVIPGGFTEGSIRRAFVAANVPLGEREALMGRLASMGETARWSGRHDADQIRRLTGSVFDSAGLEKLIAGLTKRQDLTGEVVVGSMLVLAGMLCAVG